MTIRPRNSALLIKAQAAELTPDDDFPALDPAVDAVRVENPRWGGGRRSEQTSEVTGALDPDDPIQQGAPVTVDFDVYMKGSTAAGTPPRWASKLLPSMGLKEALLAAAVPVAAEACAAGGTATLANLGDTAAATAQFYRGMPIVFSEEVTGQTFISDYTAGKAATLAETMGGAIDADVDYQIPPNSIYRFTSVDAEMPFLATEFYKDGRLYRFKNARAAGRIVMRAGSTWRLSCTMTGILHSRTDAAVPAGINYGDDVTKPTWSGGKMIVNRERVAVSEMAIDLGNKVESPPDPNAEQGFGAAFIGGRRVTATLDPKMTLIATRDFFGMMENGTTMLMLAAMGNIAGNRLAIVAPRGVVEEAPEGERNTLATEQVRAFLSGANAGFSLVIW